MKPTNPTDLLKYHVTGAIERGDATAIAAVVEPATTVIFRVFKRGGDVLALFPDEAYYGTHSPEVCMSYQRVGQHSGAHYGECITQTRPATPAEYAPLAAELERIGYVLNIRQKRSFK